MCTSHIKLRVCLFYGSRRRFGGVKEFVDEKFRRPPLVKLAVTESVTAPQGQSIEV